MTLNLVEGGVVVIVLSLKRVEGVKGITKDLSLIQVFFYLNFF